MQRQPKKNNPVKKKYYLFDCHNFVLGRMSVQIARLLQGKTTPDYAPNRMTSGAVIVTNSDKLQITGKKMKNKFYHSFSGHPGGISSRTLEEAIENDSRKVIWDSVYGMLPKNKLRDLMMKQLFIFKDTHHGIEKDLIEEIGKK